jgi:hypothetical protein
VGVEWELLPRWRKHGYGVVMQPTDVETDYGVVQRHKATPDWEVPDFIEQPEYIGKHVYIGKHLLAEC